MRSRLRGILTICLASSFVAASESPSFTMVPSHLDDSFTFMQALVDSFGYAREGLKRLDTEDPEVAAALQDPGEIMFRLKQADRNYARAATVIEPFLKSKDEVIQLSATAAHKVYTGQIELNQKTVAKLKALLDHGAASRLGSLLEWLAETRADRVELWRLLFVVVAPAATHALVELPNDPNERLSRLRVTKAQRGDLLHLLEKEFGPAVKQGVKTGSGYIEGASAVLYSFLADGRWKSADAK